MKTKQKPWTKQCTQEVQDAREVEKFSGGVSIKRKVLISRKIETFTRPCGNYMPDEYNTCDWCLITRYSKELGYAHFDSCDQIGLGPQMYEQDGVIAALRKAEKAAVAFA